MEPKVDLKAEEQKLRELSHKLLEVERHRDLDATMGFFTEDTILQPPGAPQIEGLQALQGFLQEFFLSSMGDFDSAPNKIVVSAAGDMAYDVGWYRLPSEGPEGRVVEEGKYTIVWRKVGGEWKYLVGCFNSSEPED